MIYAACVRAHGAHLLLIYTFSSSLSFLSVFPPWFLLILHMLISHLLSQAEPLTLKSTIPDVRKSDERGSDGCMT